MENKCKIGDIICRTSIADRIVVNRDGKLCCVKINNGKILDLSLDEFDVIKGSVYDSIAPPSDSSQPNRVLLPFGRIMKFTSKDEIPFGAKFLYAKEEFKAPEIAGLQGHNETVFYYEVYNQ